MLGENTEATTNVVKAFDNVFKDSDISPAAMQEVITQAAAGVKALDVGKAAFISAQTGGPGGLAGNFELKLAQREGRMDEVMQRTMEAMQNQFGGDIVSLEDAAGNQALAGELQKQMEFIKMSGLASDDNSAIRVLEAMKSGVMDQIELGVGDGSEETLRRTMDRGQEEQARTAPPLIAMNQGIEQMRLIQSNILAQGAEELNVARDTLTAMKDRASQSASTGVIGAHRESTYVGKDNNEMIEDGVGDATAALVSIASSLKEKYAPDQELAQGHGPQRPSLEPSELTGPVGTEYQPLGPEPTIKVQPIDVNVNVMWDEDATNKVQSIVDASFEDRQSALPGG